MANNGKAIVQQIRLEGGQAIKTQLEAIGAAGKKAFTDLQQAVTSSRGFGAIGGAIDLVRAKTAELGDAGRKLGNDFGELGSRAAGTATRLAAVAVATTAAVSALAAFVVKGGDTVDKLEKIAAELGITTEAWERMRNAAEQSGVDEDELARALRNVRSEQVKAQQSADGLAKKHRDLNRELVRGEVTYGEFLKKTQRLRDETNDQSDAFTRLGVSAFNADGSLRDLTAVRDDIADALQGISDGTERSARAFDVLGTRGAKTLAFFEKGSAAIQRLESASKRTAPELNKLQKEAIGLADNAFKSLRRSIDSVMGGLQATFAPTFARIFDTITEVVARGRSTLLVYAATMADRVRPIVVDLIALIEGRDKDVKNSFILKARDGVLEFGRAAKSAVTDIILPALGALLKILDTVAQAINGLFGTNLSGTQIAFALVITKFIGLFGVLASTVKVAVSAIGLLVAAFGALPVIIAAVGAAIGFYIVRGLLGVNWQAVVTAADAAWTAVKNGVVNVGTAIVGAFTTAANFVQSTFNGVVAFFAGVGAPIAAALNEAAILISNAFNTSVQFILSIWNGLIAFFVGLPGVFAAIAVSVGDAIKSAFFDAVNVVKSYIDDLWNKVSSVFNSIIAFAKRVAAAVRGAASGASAGGSGNSAPGFAGGGSVRGKGTARSDSILAWLSNGEFVMQAAAVKKWGVGFMSMLNNGGNPLSGFNVSGLVDALSSVAPRGLPGFADGGFVGAAAGGGGGGTPVYLQLPNGKYAGPMITGSEVLKLLTRESVAYQTRSAGRSSNAKGAR